MFLKILHSWQMRRGLIHHHLPLLPLFNEPQSFLWLQKWIWRHCHSNKSSSGEMYFQNLVSSLTSNDKQKSTEKRHELRSENKTTIAENSPGLFKSKPLDETIVIPNENALKKLIDPENRLKEFEGAHKEPAVIPSIDEIMPVLPVRATFNLAPFIERSVTLQELVKLGIQLCELEKKPEAAELLLKLDFESDIKPYILFLTSNGLSTDRLGYFFTKNPFIFRHPLENLQIRINYLESKKFNQEAIARIISTSPFVLNLSTRELDARLGYLQAMFSLTGNEVRETITKQPKLVCWNQVKIKQTTLSFEDELGFTTAEMKAMFLKRPKIWLSELRSIKSRFELLHNTMGLSHQLILSFPGALLYRAWRTEQRHLYLKSLGRAQYDPSKEGYVSLQALTGGADSDFCKKVAKTSLKAFNEFLKFL